MEAITLAQSLKKNNTKNQTGGGQVTGSQVILFCSFMLNLKELLFLWVSEGCFARGSPAILILLATIPGEVRSWGNSKGVTKVLSGTCKVA